MLLDRIDCRLTAAPRETLNLHGGRAYTSGNYMDSIDVGVDPEATKRNPNEGRPNGPIPVRFTFEGAARAVPAWCGYRRR